MEWLCGVTSTHPRRPKQLPTSAVVLTRGRRTTGFETGQGLQARFRWSGWGDLNSRPSVPQCDAPNFMVFTRRQPSRDFGLLSTTDADPGYLQGRRAARSVISFVIRARAEAAQNRHPKKPVQNRHPKTPVSRTWVLYPKPSDIWVPPTRHTQPDSFRPRSACSTWVPFRHEDSRVG